MAADSTLYGMSEEEAAAFQRRKKESDRASGLIAEKLLQGWALLNDNCPKGCPVPLVRNKNKEMYCVSCGAWALKDKDLDTIKLRPDHAPDSNSAGRADASHHPTPATAPPRATSALTAPPHEAPDVSGPEDKRRRLQWDDESHTSSVPPTESDSLVPESKYSAPRAADALNAVSAPGNTVRTTAPPIAHAAPALESVVSGAGHTSSTRSGGGNGVRTVSVALDALHAKLAECSQLLATTSDVSHCTAICKLMAECGNAIAALQSAQRHYL